LPNQQNPSISLFPVTLLLLLVPHSKIHGAITGSDDGKHTKADAELREIALENKLFRLVRSQDFGRFTTHHMHMR